MSKLEEARKIINEVDSKMAELFVKRMRAAEMVYEHKSQYGRYRRHEKNDAPLHRTKSFV